MNTIIKLILSLAIACMPACTITPENSAKLKAVGGKVLNVALTSVIAAAVSKSDENRKGDYLSRVGDQLVARAAITITSDDVADVVKSVTPEKSHWRELSKEIAQIYAQANPQTDAERKKVLDAIIEGLREASLSTRI